MFKRSICVIIVLGSITSGYSVGLFKTDFTEPVSVDSTKAKIRSGSLDFKFHRESGNRLWIKDDDAGVRYQIEPAIVDGEKHPTIYLSFNLRSLNETTRDKFAGVILYNDNKEVFGAGNDYGSDHFSLWDSTSTPTAIGNPATVIDSGVHKIVVRVDFDPNGPETIKVGLDPFCRRTEARQPNHIWTTHRQELDFDEIRIRCGNTDCAWEFSDLRIGTDWRSVTPSDDLPGELIRAVVADSQPAGKGEMILQNTARFWPSEVDRAKVLPSFSFESEPQSIGSVSEPWPLKPVFGTHEGQKYAYVDIPSDVDLYGTGEVTGSLIRNGYKIVLSNKDCYNYHKADQLYQSHPWVLGVYPDGTAFGIMFDTPWQAELDLRAGILFTTLQEAPDFPVIVIKGSTPQEVMTRLGELTGTMPMPPRWTLGYQQCRYSYYPDARVREIADTFRAKRIPCDVIWFDIHYMDGYRVFTFNHDLFPDPKATNAYLHDLGFKSVWMIDPGVKYDPGYAVYDSGTKIDAWVKDNSGKTYVGPVWPGDCVFPDFTVPAVNRWWSGLYQDFMAQGIDGVWNDMDEPSVFNADTNGTMPMDNLHRGGGDLPAGPHAQYHNVYGMLMVKASREGIRQANPEKRPFVLTRANFLGGHRYAATWTGDNWASWQHLKWSIPMSLNLSLSGQPFNGPDIGGFLESAAPDLWGHWIAVGAFYPFSRAHTCDGTANQEPWEFGPEVENAARTALQKRYRLMPYLYTVFQQAHAKGLPVMRPVFFADPTDLSLRMEDQAFLLGPDVMIVPRWADNPKQPSGIWRTVSILDEKSEDDPYQCDIKLRGGAIVPLGPVVQTTQQIGTVQQLTLLIVLDEQGRARGIVYEDAGEGYAYKQGQYGLSTFTAEQSGNRVTVKCADLQGDLRMESRMVNIMVVAADTVYHGLGDICSKQGVSIECLTDAE